jgi:hypothetical protein
MVLVEGTGKIYWGERQALGNLKASGLIIRKQLRFWKTNAQD